MSDRLPSPWEYNENVMLGVYWRSKREKNSICSFNAYVYQPVHGRPTAENIRRNQEISENERFKFIILQFLKYCQAREIVATEESVQRMLERETALYEKPFNTDVVKFMATHLMSLVEFHRDHFGSELYFKLKTHVHYSRVF